MVYMAVAACTGSLDPFQDQLAAFQFCNCHACTDGMLLLWLVAHVCCNYHLAKQLYTEYTRPAAVFAMLQCLLVDT